MKNRTFILAAILLTVGVSIYAQERPFLIVQESDFATLREKQNISPWKEIKSKAEADAIKAVSSNVDAPMWVKISNKAAGAALIYILDETQATRESCIANILDAVNTYPADEISNDWQHYVPLTSAFMNCLLAYDIVYKGMTSSQRTTAYTKLAQIGSLLSSTVPNSWLLSAYGARGLWAMSEGDTAATISIVNQYVSRYKFSLLTPNGMFEEGTGYSWQRLGADGYRDSKSCFLDIIEYHDLAELYPDERIIKFTEWLYTTLSPFKHIIPFGDACPAFNVNDEYSSPALYRAARISERAGELANWITTKPTGSTLLTYIFHKEFPDASPPQSSSNPDGYAGFWEEAEDVNQNSLMGALWCGKKADYHSHSETNSIYIAGFGEHLIRNTGYNGAGQGLLGFTWEDISSNAYYGNTVLINDANHSSKVGGGIDEAFFSSSIDYASGLSGPALSSNKHIRNFIFVKPTASNHGYFLLFDEVDAANSSHHASVSIHPNSDDYQVVTADQEYHFNIKEYTTGGADVNIFLATEPDHVMIDQGPIGNSTWNGGGGLVGDFLYSTYSTDASGTRNILSAILPYKDGITKPGVSRITVTNGTGAKIDHTQGVIDHAIAQETDTVSSYGAVSFNGKAVLYRTVSDKLNFYFARKATSFAYDVNIGFTSTLPVTVYMEVAHGKIVSPGTEVTFIARGIMGVMLNDSLLTPIETSGNSVTVTIPAGRHDISLDGVTQVIAPSNLLPRHFTLNQNYPNPFSRTTSIGFSLPKREFVTLEVLNPLGQTVAVLESAILEEGAYTHQWDASNHPRGLYLFRLKTSDFSQTRKMLLVQ